MHKSSIAAVAIYMHLCLTAWSQCLLMLEASAQVTIGELRPCSAVGRDSSQASMQEGGVTHALRTLCQNTSLPVILITDNPPSVRASFNDVGSLQKLVLKVAKILNATVHLTPEGWVFRGRNLKGIYTSKSQASAFEERLVKICRDFSDSLLSRMPLLDVSTHAIPFSELSTDLQKRMRAYFKRWNWHIRGEVAQNIIDGKSKYKYDFFLHQIPSKQLRISMVCTMVAQFKVNNITGVLEMQPGIHWIEAMRMVDKWMERKQKIATDGKRILVRCIYQGMLKNMIAKFRWADTVDRRIGNLHVIVWSPHNYPLIEIKKLVLNAAGLKIRYIGKLTHIGLSCDGYTWNVHECVARWTLNHSLLPVSLFESLLLQPRWVSMNQLTLEQLSVLRSAFEKFSWYNQQLLKGLRWHELLRNGKIFVAERIALHVYLFSQQGVPVREVTIIAHSATPTL